jgi:hypothetical protein
VTGISFFVGLGHRDTFALRFISTKNAILAGPVGDDLKSGVLTAYPCLLIEE